MARFPDLPDVAPIPTPAPARLIPPGGGGSEPTMTLAALMARQKAMAERQQGVMQNGAINIPQGLAQMAWSAVNALGERRAAEQEAEGRQQLAGILSGFDPSAANAQQSIGQVSMYDPELSYRLSEQMIQARRDAAAAAERAAARPKYGAVVTGDAAKAQGLDPTKSYQLNESTGQYEQVGSSGGITIQNAPEGAGAKKWEETNAAQLSENLNQVFKSGQDASLMLGKVGAMESLMPTMLTGTEAAIATYLKNSWGINLGDSVDKTTAFNAIVDSLVPYQRPPGSGTMSDKDVQLFKSALPSMLASPEANQLVISYLRGIAEYQQQMGAIANQALAQPNAADARTFFYNEAGKLANPLAGFQEQLSKMTGGAGGEGELTPDVQPDGTVIYRDAAGNEVGRKLPKKVQ